MSITRKIAAVSIASLTMGAVFSTNQAQARGWGVGLGISLGALVGAAAASSYYSYYARPAYVVTPGYWKRRSDVGTNPPRRSLSERGMLMSPHDYVRYGH